MPRDSKHERQLKLEAARRSQCGSAEDFIAKPSAGPQAGRMEPLGLPVFKRIGRPPGAEHWIAYLCGREECKGIMALRKRDTKLLLKMCPHCFRSGKLPQREDQ